MYFTDKVPPHPEVGLWELASCWWARVWVRDSVWATITILWIILFAHWALKNQFKWGPTLPNASCVIYQICYAAINNICWSEEKSRPLWSRAQYPQERKVRQTSSWDTLSGKRKHGGKEGCLRSDVCILKHCTVDRSCGSERRTVGIKSYVCVNEMRRWLFLCSN